MNPKKPTICVALASLEEKKLPVRQRRGQHRVGVHDCPSCTTVLKILLENLVYQTSHIADDRILQFSPSDQVKSSEQLGHSQSLMDVSVYSFGNQAKRSSSASAARILCEQIHLADGIVCPFLQNGRSVVDDTMHCSDSIRDDSGFGSGPEPCHSRSIAGTDIEVLERNMSELNDSGCYHGPLDNTGARQLLKKSAMGTFLVRDSSDPNYLYSLTVKTERGATSVRILYSNGLFQFDSDEKLRHRLPQFESIMSLIDFHMMLSRDGKNQSWRWEENSGKKMMKVVLEKPRKCSVSSLKHLSRVRINQCLEDVHLPDLSVNCLHRLSSRLKAYLKEYPYRV